MPNWCWNHLTVMCTEEHVAELQDFVEKSTSAKDAEFSFEGTLPRGNREDSYHWSWENWGTKWDACEPDVNESESQCFCVGFDTAWSPPTKWLHNIMNDYPNLEFELEYDEPGMCFAGVLNAHGAIGRFHDHYFETDSASQCCQAKVFYEDDEEYTLEDGEYQCSECKKECETFMMNESKIKNNV